MKKKKKSAKKAVQRRPVRHEVVVRVASQLPMVPTVDELAQPITQKDGKDVELALPKTWVSEKQILRMVQKTPPQFVYERPAKGGGKWKYVTAAYVERVLNYVFGFMWDFEVLEHGVVGGVIWVKGKLTVKDPKGNTITKTQFGRKEVAYRRDSKRTEADMLDFGNDLKAATSDALKKCASLLGIASDIYAPSEYKQESGTTPRETPRESQQNPSQPAPQVDGPVEEFYCHGVGKSGCPSGAELTPQEKDYSVKMYGKPLCRDCQKFAKKK